MEGWRQWRLGGRKTSCSTKKQENSLDSDRPSHGRRLRSSRFFANYRRRCSNTRSTMEINCSLSNGFCRKSYRVLDEAGSVLLEQRVSTTLKAMKEVFGGMPRCRIALETAMHSP
jgi:hypothetical protein